MAEVRVRIEVREWAEFTVDPEWFAGEAGESKEELWNAVKDLYTESDPGLAWEATEGASNRVIVTRLDEPDSATTAYINPDHPEPS